MRGVNMAIKTKLQNQRTWCRGPSLPAQVMHMGGTPPPQPRGHTDGLTRPGRLTSRNSLSWIRPSLLVSVSLRLTVHRFLQTTPFRLANAFSMSTIRQLPHTTDIV